jgi:hypothetical protein
MGRSMKRIFCHINELGQGAWELLPVMLLLADEVVLWAPGAAALNAAHLQGMSPFGPKDVLSLVEAGVVRIGARSEFIDSEAFRNRSGSWDGQHWFAPFDEAIRSIARSEDLSLPRDRRILRVDRVRGFEWADQQIQGKTPALQIAKRLLRSNRIPIGTRERIERNFAKPTRENWGKHRRLMSIREILRDARNHEDARDDTASDVSFDISPFPVLEFNEMAAASPLKPIETKVQAPEILDFFQWVGSLKYSGDIATLQKIRENPEHREQFWRLLQTDYSPLEGLLETIGNGLPKQSVFETDFGASPIVAGSEVAGVAVAAVGVAVTKRWFTLGGLLASAGFALAAIPPIDEELMREGYLPDTNYRGPVWPFLLATDTVEPSLTQINQLLSEITTKLSTFRN